MGKSVRGSRLFLIAANWSSQRNGEASSVVLNIFNASAEVYINLLYNTKMFSLTKETGSSLKL